MRYSVVYGHKAKKSLKKLGGNIRKQIKAKFDKLANEDPTASKYQMRVGSIKIKHYKIRVGVFRVIYQVVDDKMIILVVDIDNRDDVYGGF